MSSEINGAEGADDSFLQGMMQTERAEKAKVKEVRRPARGRISNPLLAKVAGKFEEGKTERLEPITAHVDAWVKKRIEEERRASGAKSDSAYIKELFREIFGPEPSE